MSDLNDRLATDLADLRSAGLYRTWRNVESAQGARIVIDGRTIINFSSNDYLGLANDPLLTEAARAAVAQYGLGAGASRLVCGNLQPYTDLENRLATFKGKEAAIVFGSGYTANVGTITALVGPGDVVILDKLDHASIIDGARLSGATIRVYPHKNLAKLERLLAGAAETKSATQRVLVVTETVFSMDGDIAPLTEIAALKRQYGAWLMLDEAHAHRVVWPFAPRLAQTTGVKPTSTSPSDAQKALGCSGGSFAAPRVIDYLRNRPEV